VEKLLQSKNFQSLGPGQLILDPTLVSGDFGYRLLSWQALEKDLDLRRQLMEGSSDIVELTPDLAAPTQGRVETGRNAPEITEREVAGMLTQAKGRGVPAAGEDLPLREQMEQFERALILAPAAGQPVAHGGDRAPARARAQPSIQETPAAGDRETRRLEFWGHNTELPKTSQPEMTGARVPYCVPRTLQNSGRIPGLQF
jgi:hypothetical protein